MNMDGEQSVQTIGAIFLMHFASFSTKRTRQAYRMKPTKTLLHGKVFQKTLMENPFYCIKKTSLPCVPSK